MHHASLSMTLTIAIPGCMGKNVYKGERMCTNGERRAWARVGVKVSVSMREKEKRLARVCMRTRVSIRVSV